MKNYDSAFNQLAIDIRVQRLVVLLAVIWRHPLAFLTAET